MSIEPVLTDPPADAPAVPEAAGGDDSLGTDDEATARIRLLDWIDEQIAAGVVRPAVGDYVLATDGRILGYGPDWEELNRRVDAAEPGLRAARVVGMRVTPADW